MESIEASGRTVEDAILQALARLGRNRDEVEIAVLQEPSRGNRGMGMREARVRVWVPDGASDEMDQAEQLPLAPPAPSRHPIEPDLPTMPLREVVPEDASIEEIAVAALETLLAHMGVQAQVEVVEPAMPAPEAAESAAEDAEGDETDEEPLTLNIRTSDQHLLGLLIGRRGETLAALQLIVNLIVAKQAGHRDYITVDAEGYRARRESNLRDMAQRIASQVVKSGMPVPLEAMSPAERRIIHMALADHAQVRTESTGEGDQRRVVIKLK